MTTNKISEFKKQKIQEVSEMSELLKKASSVIVWDYQGLSAEEISDLRKRITKAQGTNKVYKNTLANLAFKNSGKEEISSTLVGPSSFLFTFNDNNESLKILHTEISKNKKIKFKAGYIDGIFYDQAGITEMAGLGTKSEILSSLLSVLQANMRNLAYSLSQVAESKTE